MQEIITLRKDESDLESQSKTFFFGGLLIGFFSEPIILSISQYYLPTLENYLVQAGLSSLPATMHGKGSQQRTLNFAYSATGLFVGQVCSNLLRRFSNI